MKTLGVLCLLAVMSLSLNSCHGLFDNDEECTSCNQGQGTLKGNVLTVDSTGAALDDLAGTFVTITGNTYSNVVATGANGKWQFDHVPAGVYQFSFDKPGYGGVKKYNFQFVGNGTLDVDSVYLGRAPKFAVEISSLALDVDQLVVHITSAEPPTFQKRSVLVVSKQPTPSPLDSSNYSAAQVGTVSPTGGDFTHFEGVIFMTPLRERFHTGDTCYIAAFGLGNVYHIDYYNGYFPSTYQNPITGSNIYTATGPSSNVLQFVMP